LYLWSVVPSDSEKGFREHADPYGEVGTWEMRDDSETIPAFGISFPTKGQSGFKG